MTVYTRPRLIITLIKYNANRKHSGCMFHVQLPCRRSQNVKVKLPSKIQCRTIAQETISFESSSLLNDIDFIFNYRHMVRRRIIAIAGNIIEQTSADDLLHQRCVLNCAKYFNPREYYSSYVRLSLFFLPQKKKEILTSS